MQHFYKTIPGWAAFAQLYIDVVRIAKPGAHFVEIGSWAGRSAALMAVEIYNSGKDIRFDCIDPWYDGGVDLRDTEHQKLLGDVPLLEQFKKNLGPVLHLVNPIQATSLEAVVHYDDKAISFLMIDGDHSYEAVRDDIAAYMPKMRNNAIISGDDYNWPGVKQAVDEAFGSRAKVFGRNHPSNYKLGAQHWMAQL
jgi:predicted O-methyltransferase YrrM